MDEVEFPVVSLVWATVNAEQLILRIARVSSANPDSGKTELLQYLQRNGHWSPFEMASMCVEIQCSRDIARQILRHRSFSFQEFSQRYQDVSIVQGDVHLREARMQNAKNRQQSDCATDPNVIVKWALMQRDIWTLAKATYDEALSMGIAKEQARALLPEGLTQTKLYMSGTFRSWIHYVESRTGHGTQQEHAAIALLIKTILQKQLPHLQFE